MGIWSNLVLSDLGGWDVMCVLGRVRGEDKGWGEGCQRCKGEERNQGWYWLCLVLEVKRKGEGGFDRSQTWGGIWLG